MRLVHWLRNANFNLGCPRKEIPIINLKNGSDIYSSYLHWHNVIFLIFCCPDFKLILFYIGKIMLFLCKLFGRIVDSFLCLIERFLKGASSIDQHFYSTPLEKNIPVCAFADLTFSFIFVLTMFTLYFILINLLL